MAVHLIRPCDYYRSYLVKKFVPNYHISSHHIIQCMFVFMNIYFTWFTYNCRLVVCRRVRCSWVERELPRPGAQVGQGDGDRGRR